MWTTREKAWKKNLMAANISLRDFKVLQFFLKLLASSRVFNFLSYCGISKLLRREQLAKIYFVQIPALRYIFHLPFATRTAEERFTITRFGLVLCESNMYIVLQFPLSGWNSRRSSMNYWSPVIVNVLFALYFSHYKDSG